MTSSATICSTLGDPKHGGALFTLPREVRDDIYRLVVRKRYVIYITRRVSHASAPSRDKHDFAILQISKAINHEASNILYAESVFRFSMNFYSYKVSSVPAHLANRMRNAEIDFHGLSYDSPLSYPYEDTNDIFDAAFANFPGTDIRRNHLHIRLFDCFPGKITMLSTHLSKRLNAFIGFHTVLIEVDSVCTLYLRRVRSTNVQKSFEDLEEEMTILMAQQILRILTPVLGPAQTAVPGNVSCYILHPQDHLASSADRIADVQGVV